MADMEWLKSNVEKLTDNQKDELREAFDLYDVNKDNIITLAELQFTLTSLGQDPTDQDVAEMIATIDQDNDGKIDFDEFQCMMAAKLFSKDGRVQKIQWAHKVPIPYCWDTSFATLYSRIDDEHRVLFQRIWTCHENRENSYDLLNMVATMQQHFTYEEGCMKASKHEGYVRHKQVHDEYMERLKNFSIPVSDSDIKYCMSWLTNHIKNTDFKYKGKLLYQNNDPNQDLLAC